jgi:aspartyl protease family protein
MADPQGPWRHPPPPPPKTRSRLGLLLWLGLMAAAAAVFFLLMRLFPEQRSGMEWADAFRLFGLLALVSSGLVATRSLDLGLAARNIALWAAIFALAFLAYAFRGDLLSVGLRARSALIPAYAVANSPTSIVVSRGEGGGFYVMGSVNGAPVRFIVDTGASDIVLSPKDAASAGLLDDTTTFSRPSETANGIGYGAPVTVNSLAVGPIHLSKVPVFINQAPMRESLLGMAFLDRLESFEFRGDQLFLRGRR